MIISKMSFASAAAIMNKRGMRRILVLGSLNIDLVQRVPRIPAPGETLKGGDLEIFSGGKGANQACAAARLGADVYMAGKVGRDAFGERLRRELAATGVHTERVGESGRATGSGTIFVLPDGENMIVIASGANADISPQFAREVITDLRPGDLLLCQLEIPLEAVQAAVTAAHALGVVTMLDPAPGYPLPDDLLRAIDILTPNQTETAILLARTESPENFAEAELAARELQGRGANTVIVKMGALGCLLAQGVAATARPGFLVQAVDTTAAGDTFNGALAASLARDGTLLAATQFANAAAALSVTKPGAIASIPSLDDVEEFLGIKVAMRS